MAVPDAAVTAAVLGLAWGGLVVLGLRTLGLRGLRPSPRRVRALVPLVARRSFIARPRLRPPAGRVMAAAFAAFVSGLVLPVLTPLVAAAVWSTPVLFDRRAARRREEALAACLPETVDLLALAVASGLTNRLALEAVVRHSRGPLAAELGRLLEQVRLGRRLSDALEGLPVRAGEATRPLATALLASERYGSSLAQGLERLADEVRRRRRRRAEEAARRVPVKLLFPLVLCVLPAFGLLTVAPLLASALRSLRL